MERERSIDRAPTAGTGAKHGVPSWEHLGNLRRLKAALLFGCIAWPFFALVDLLYAAAGGEGDLRALLAIRMIPVPWFVIATWRVGRRPAISQRELLGHIYVGIYVLMIVITMQCMVTGGIRSLHAEAALAVLAATAVVPRPWRAHAAPMALAALVYPLGMILGQAYFPPMRGQLAEPGALPALGTHVMMLWTTTLIVVLSSHRSWVLRREIYEMRSVGRYELRRRIGKGGMGEVWAAWHRGLEREVAIKILKLADEEDQAAALRFEREVRLSSGLTHPHTVRVFDYGTTEDGLLYYAMELLDGASLAQLVRREGPMPPARAVHLVTQAARALAEAHDRGIVHRDVKPENLFVTAAGGESDFVKVLDFGIAHGDAEAADLTRTGAVAGSPSTMSPEVICGGRASAASDVYGLGAVLYFTLTGRAPFVGEGAAATLVAHLREAVVPPGERAPHPIPHDVEAIVMRCLAKSPGDRFPDGRALAEALASSSVAGQWEPASGPIAVAGSHAGSEGEGPSRDTKPEHGRQRAAAAPAPRAAPVAAHDGGRTSQPSHDLPTQLLTQRDEPTELEGARRDTALQSTRKPPRRS